MGACNRVGRVGGLAVALGVGATIFGGTSTAWADAVAESGGAAVGSAAGANAANANQGVTTALRTRVGAIGSRSGARPAATRTGVTTLPSKPSVKSRTRVPAGAFAVSGVLTAAPDPLADSPATSNPTAPIESPLSWTAMAYARRQSAPANAVTAAPAAAVATQPVILGPSGVPIPPDWYVAKVMEYYMPAGANPPQVVFTPEGLYPITGVKSLPLSTSVDQGLTILSDTLTLLPAGTATTMFGYSQSAIIGSLIQSGYNDTPVPPTVADSVDFVFVGNEMNPNGGLLSRFPGLDLPSLGIPFYGATPENAYPTTNYTLEYDGFADVPRYPINFLADLNAALGILYVHTKYTPKADCKNFCTTLQQVQDAIALPSTSPTEKYYFMPTENLPLVQPLRGIPFVGTPIADLIQPALKVLVDLGYADPAHGFASAVQPIANVQVPFGLIPQVNPREVISMLVAGVKQGIHDFINDFGKNGSIAREISAMKGRTPSLASSQDFIAKLQNAISGFSAWLSTAAGAMYTPLLPTADIANALIVSLPAYDLNLALSSVKQMISGEPIKGLINAVGLPFASSVGLITYASLIELLVWGQSARALVPA